MSVRDENSPECEECGSYNYNTNLCPRHLILWGLEIAAEERDVSPGDVVWLGIYDVKDITQRFNEIVERVLAP